MPTGKDAAYIKGNPDDTTNSVNDADEYTSHLSRGAATDARDMYRLGKKQEFRVSRISVLLLRHSSEFICRFFN